MKGVVLESDARPVEDVVFGPGGMEQNRRRSGTLAVAINIQGTAAVAANLTRLGRMMGMRFARSMRQVALTSGATREQMAALEEAILAERRLGKSKQRQAFELLEAELQQLGLEVEQAMIAYGEWMLRTISRVQSKLRSWWAILCR